MSEILLLRISYLLPIAGLFLSFAYYGIGGDLSSDSNLYIFVGDNFWRGDSLLQIDGDFFAAHGPIFPLLYSALYGFAGKEIIQVLVFVFLGFSFLLGIYITERIFSARAALFTALIFLATPFFWVELDKGSIDYLQLFVMALFLLSLLKPTQERFALAGFLFGVMLLSKETMALALLAPLAWLGSRETLFVLRRYLIFLATAFLTAAWWWVVVFYEAGVFFPSQQLEYAYGLNERSTLEIIFPLLFIAALVPFVILYRKKPQPRLLLFLALASVPPSLLSFLNSMDERQFVIFSFFSAIVLASVIDKSLTLLKNQNLAFAFSLLPLFLLVLFPITLSSQKSNSIKRSEPYASGVLRKAIEEEGKNRVLIHNNKTIDMRVIARKTAVAYFEETEAKDCPCPSGVFQKGRFLEQLKSNNFFLILKDGSLLAASKQIPGLTLLWQSPSESSAVFRIDQKELPEKNIFYQDYLKILLKASLLENADSRDPKE